jgi:hypothetical protein
VADALFGLRAGSRNFLAPPPGVELIEGDLSDLAAVPGLAGRRFDRILFLQSFGYASAF